jgi:hypothetical protein
MGGLWLLIVTNSALYVSLKSAARIWGYEP